MARKNRCGLLWRNVRPRGDTGQVTVFGKNGRTRSIALNKGIWMQLAELRGTAGPEAPVFPSRSGKIWDQPAETWRGPMIDAVVSIRRGVDLLLQRSDVDPKRLGFAGHS